MLNLTRYRPLAPYSLIDSILDDFLVPQTRADATNAPMRLDISETDDAYTVRAELAGIKKEDIHVSIDGGDVTISAESRAEKDVKDGERVLRSERYFGKLERSFRLAQSVDESAAEAKYADGILELRLPKARKAKNREITVQ